MGLKLNLGCGDDFKEGYLNVDKFGEPELKVDLETVPWPWADDSVAEILLKHVLEHLGRETDVYLGIIQEIYRICANNALIQIEVPHPRHDTFLHDPTHVRPITPEGTLLFSQQLNREWMETGAPNSLLGIFLGVDFELENTSFSLDPVWATRVKNGEVQQEELAQAIRTHNNVAQSISMRLRVVKPGRAASD